jgi:hypothetical protein
MTIIRYAISPGLMAAALLVSGCVGGQPPTTSGFVSKTRAEPQRNEVEERKDEIVRQLATCESGGSGPSDRPIYGGRGAYVGRLQFSLQTVISYQRMRDGTQLTRQEAAELAHDYDRAASLAKYMIFDLEEPFHWPLCSRKVALRNEMAHIKQLSNQALAQ